MKLRRSLPVTLALVAFFLIAGPAILLAQHKPFGLQDPHDKAFAKSWGCDPDPTVGTLYIGPPMPDRGSTVCELLARTGKPDDVQLTAVGDLRETDWTYHADGHPMDIKLVTLEYSYEPLDDGSHWMITAISW